MNIFNINQIKALDRSTIEKEPIASIDLMERAATALCDWIFTNFPDNSNSFTIFAGKGNNGGDGLAMARLLYLKNYQVKVYYLHGDRFSDDFQINLERLRQLEGIKTVALKEDNQLPPLPLDTIVIDALLGSGIQGEVKGPIKSLITLINDLSNYVISIDVPSGLLADEPTTSSSISADVTLTLESPKRGFLYPENASSVGKFEIIFIGLDESSKKAMLSEHHYTTKAEISALVKARNTFDHKGVFGHALLVNGSYGKIGAAILASRACLRSGVGLLTVHTPKCGYDIMQSTIPECMVQTDVHDRVVTSIPKLNGFDAIGIGCGIGISPLSCHALTDMFEKCKGPLVLDADALNIMSTHPELICSTPKDSILTPHVKEFSRLFGTTQNDFERNDLQRAKSVELGVFIILKGAHTAISCPDGNCYYNSTGNPGMATAGSGDTLTGVLTGLMAQGYSSKEACLIGVFVHGLAGDLAADKLGHESLIASDIIDHLGYAFKEIHNREIEI